MINTKPRLSNRFAERIKQTAIIGTYRVNLSGILIDVFPYVFPPQSPFSESTHTVYNQFGDLHGKAVLDLGTGTGILAIQAALAGASVIDAVDIYEGAVRCAGHNIQLNNLGSRIKVWESDLFNKVPKREYDLMMANLPIVEAEESDLKFHSLFDPKFNYHERLFHEASSYLSCSGWIILPHANLQENGFGRLESIALKHGFQTFIKQKTNSLGYEWRNYEFRR